MKKSWGSESYYEEIFMLPTVDLTNHLIEDYCTLDRVRMKTLEALKPVISYYARKNVLSVSPPDSEEESDTEIDVINQNAAAILTRIRSASISSPDSEEESDTEVDVINQNAAAILTRIRSASISSPDSEEESDSEIAAINQNAAANLASINESSNSLSRSTAKSPPILIPRRSTPSPLTTSALFVTPVLVTMAGGPKQNSLPSTFLTPPIHLTSAAIAAARTRRSMPPIMFRGNSASSLVSFHTLTPATTPTSTELLAQEACLVSVMPGLVLN